MPISSFKHKGLAELWSEGRTGRVDQKMQKLIVMRLTALDNATALGDVQLPGYRLHALEGFEPTRYSIWVNGPWRLTFEFDGRDFHRVDLEQYH